MQQRAPLAQPMIHLRLEEADRAAPVRLRPVERGIGIADQRGRVGTVDRIERDADAQSDAHALSLDLEILRHGGEQALGEARGLARQPGSR